MKNPFSCIQLHVAIRIKWLFSNLLQASIVAENVKPSAGDFFFIYFTQLDKEKWQVERE